MAQEKTKQILISSSSAIPSPSIPESSNLLHALSFGWRDGFNQLFSTATSANSGMRVLLLKERLKPDLAPFWDRTFRLCLAGQDEADQQTEQKYSYSKHAMHAVGNMNWGTGNVVHWRMDISVA